MQENYLRKSLALTAIVAGILLLLGLLPVISAGTWKLKRIIILADIQPSAPVKKYIVAKTDTTHITAKPQEIKAAPLCPPGITCIEDFSEDRRALSAFFKALRSSDSKAVRVAFFGDSFIEGDILCSNFRDTLQGIFGGRGVGYVPITSEVAQYRTTIQHSFSNWKTYSIVGAKDKDSPLGTSGYCFRPLEANEVEYRPAKRRPHDRFYSARLFYENPGHGELRYTLNDTSEFTTGLAHSDSLQQIIIPEHNFSSIRLKLDHSDSMRIYGASFEGGAGIYVDNFSMRGNSGMGLYQIEVKEHRAFNRFRDYKLILLQYGLNVVSETDSAGYSWYIDRMTRVISRMKESFPGASFVLIGVSDRSSNQDGKFATMPNIPIFRDAQREIAQRSHIAFWDLFEAMGGNDAMLGYVKATPPLAAKDYTHLTYWGGKKLAKKLADALLYERKKYEARN